MAEENTQDRTEEASPRRREEARERGQIPMSADVSQAVVLLAGVSAMWVLSNQLATMLLRMVRGELQGLYRPEMTIRHITIMMRVLLGNLTVGLMPMLLSVLLIAAAVGAAQAGLSVSFKPLNANWSRLSLTQGWGRMFSMRSAVRGIMMLLKMSLGLGVIGWLIWSKRDIVVALGRQPLELAVTETWTFGLRICLALGGTLLSIGIVDYLFQRWQHEQDLKMSRQDLKDEHKRDEGDPQLKSQRKRMARESLKLQMLNRVPVATVVLTNPTHIAIALQYDRETMGAPRVIAKGTDAFAKRIAAKAREHGIPVLERKPLARALFASVDVDQEIPPNLYRAIAEILAHLHELRDAG